MKILKKHKIKNNLTKFLRSNIREIKKYSEKIWKSNYKKNFHKNNKMKISQLKKHKMKISQLKKHKIKVLKLINQGLNFNMWIKLRILFKNSVFKNLFITM
jgi:hypothetical protein